MVQSGRFLGRLHGSLPKAGLPLMKSVLKPLAKSILIPLELTAATSGADGGILKKILGWGMGPSNLAQQTTLLISNEEMGVIIKIVESLEESGLLMKGVREIIKTKSKEQKGGTLSGASLLGNLLTVKALKAKIHGLGVVRACEGTIRADQDI